MFGIVPKPLWEQKLPADHKNRIEMNCRMFLILTDTKKIVIDLGVGDYHPDKFNRRFGLLDINNPVEQVLSENLKISTDDITDVIVTHLHFDHVGGLGTGDGSELMFKNATFHLNKNHYEYSKNPTPRDAGSFHFQYFSKLVEEYSNLDQINWLTEESEILNDNNYSLKFKLSHGHTPYQVLPYDDKMIYLGDLLPTSHHLNLAWTMGYDLHPGDCSIEREKIYDWIIEKNLVMVFDHDKDYWGAKIKKDSFRKYSYEKLYQSLSNDFEEHQL